MPYGKSMSLHVPLMVGSAPILRSWTRSPNYPLYALLDVLVLYISMLLPERTNWILVQGNTSLLVFLLADMDGGCSIPTHTTSLNHVMSCFGNPSFQPLTLWMLRRLVARPCVNIRHPMLHPNAPLPSFASLLRATNHRGLSLTFVSRAVVNSSWCPSTVDDSLDIAENFSLLLNFHDFTSSLVKSQPFMPINDTGLPMRRIFSDIHIYGRIHVLLPR